MFKNNRPVSSVVKHTAVSAGGLGFDSRVGQIKHSVNGSPPLSRFFKAVLLSHGGGPRHPLRAAA